MRPRDGAHTSRVQALLPYILYLTRQQIPLRQLLVKHGLHRHDLSSPLAHLPTEVLLAFSHDVAAAVKDHQVGLRIAGCTKPEDTVCLGLFMSYASTVREALLLTIDSIGASQNCAMYSLSPVEGGSAFIFRYEGYDASLARYEMEHLAATLVKLIRSRLTEAWAPMEVHFEHVLKGRLATYEQYFGGPVFFEQPVNQIVMRTQHLDQKSETQPNALTAYFRERLFHEYATNLRSEMELSGTLPGRVGVIISQRLREADCTLPAVASELNMSVRSLQRHLAMEGTNFQDIVRQQRHRIAMTLLKGEKRTTTADIAASVGYSDRTTLSRAFKSWTGVAPKSYSLAARSRRESEREAGAATDFAIPPLPR
jgi:AraC-like DNA-binding protein